MSSTPNARGEPRRGLASDAQLPMPSVLVRFEIAGVVGGLVPRYCSNAAQSVVGPPS